MSDIINASFEEGVFPSQLKLAKVIPIHKNGAKNSVSNYRPISLLSSFSKIFEKLMHSRIYNFLESNNSLYEMQYGFRTGRSCEHALLMAQHELINAMSKKQIALLLLIDFSKAFDMVDHDILLSKLVHYGIRGNAYNWLKSYLCDRKQYVWINGKKSKVKDLLYGVPQGSILGPLLFIIYINDLPQISKLAKFIMYADDANIIITGNNMSEIAAQFNEIGNLLTSWVSCNGLALNIRKTNYMIFTKNRIHELDNFKPKISGIPIEHKTVTRFLGVLIDEKLTWKHHITAIKSKMSKYIGILYRLKNILPLTARKNIFHSFIQSHINYCSLIWGTSTKSNIDSIFVVQKKAMRALMPGNVNQFYIDGSIPTHTKPSFTKFNILTVHNIILKNILIFMQKIHRFHNTLPVSLRQTISQDAPVPGSTHENCSSWLEKYSKNLYANSLFYKGPLFYTDIAPELEKSNHYTSIEACKCRIKSYLLSSQCTGTHDEWQAVNFKLQNTPGLRRSKRPLSRLQTTSSISMPYS